jgi:Icc-related predicted phosphoesterase
VTSGDDQTIFYVADIHGSDLCFRKWLNAGRFYGADVLVIGGDLTGKVLLPIYAESDGGGGAWTASWKGRQLRLETRSEVDELIRTARNEGAYGYVTTPDEVAAIRSSRDLEREVFTRLKLEALEGWSRLADERIADDGVRALVMAGNDDPPEVDRVLAEARRLEDVGGRAVELAPGIWMASRGESTPTPWNTPRELPDEALGVKVREVVDGLPAGGVSIWNLHMPPHRTGIDEAPELDADLRVRYDGSGEPRMRPVGSKTIKGLIAEREPTLALHGHIHEGRGRYRIGRTTGANPGSQYQDGVLMGVLIRVSARHGVRDLTFTAG